MGNKRLTIIDADSLCYIVGSHETLEEAVLKVDERITNIVRNTKADYISLFISKGRYFRHNIFSDYKGNRTQKPPKWMRSIKSYLEDKYEANWMVGVEADDLVAYWMNQKLGITTVEYKDLKNDTSIYKDQLVPLNYASKLYDLDITMSAIDKDLLNSIPGKHWNYTFKKEDKSIEKSPIIEGCWVETSDILGQCEIFKATQLLMGDSSDGVMGLEKVGPVGASKILSQAQDNMDALIPIAFNEYISRLGNSNGIYEFQKNYRLLHMLDCDEDFIREIGKIPEFPQINKVKHEIIQDSKVEF